LDRDLKDDCSAIWQGLMLRAEVMNRTDWWWAVYDMKANEPVAVSYDMGVRVTNGKKARWTAEQAARDLMAGKTVS
jgi:hypothetical protein